jgi:hypothetical protein
MTRVHSRDAAIDEAFAGLATVDAAPGLAEAVRCRMHHQLTQQTRRRTRRGALTKLPHRLAAQTALVAALVLLYLAGVVSQALGFYEPY